MNNIIDKNIGIIEKRAKYIAIISMYFIFMFTEVISYPIAKILIKTIDIFDINVEKEQINAMFQFLFFTVLTITFIIMSRKDLKEDFAKTKATAFSHDDNSIEGINFFLKVIFTYAIYMVIGMIVAIVLTLLPITLESSQNQENIENITTGGSTIPISMILTIVFLGPFVEEIVFRLAIFKIVPHVVPAVLLSTFVFAGIHIDFGSEPFYLILSYIPAGVALSLSYYFSKNIFVTIATHVGMNAIAVMFMIIPALLQ